MGVGELFVAHRAMQLTGIAKYATVGLDAIHRVKVNTVLCQTLWCAIDFFAKIFRAPIVHFFARFQTNDAILRHLFV